MMDAEGSVKWHWYWRWWLRNCALQATCCCTSLASAHSQSAWQLSRLPGWLKAHQWSRINIQHWSSRSTISNAWSSLPSRHRAAFGLGFVVFCTSIVSGYLIHQVIIGIMKWDGIQRKNMKGLSLTCMHLSPDVSFIRPRRADNYTSCFVQWYKWILYQNN